MAPNAQQRGRQRNRRGGMAERGPPQTETWKAHQLFAGGRLKSLQQGGRLMRQGVSASCQDQEACIAVGQQMQRISETLRLIRLAVC